MNEAVNIYKNSIVPAAREMPGFKGTALFINEAANTVISISQWETEADMQAGEDSGYLQAQFAKVAPFFAGSPASEHYEVAV